jgi:hypothetical protein
MGLKCLGLCFGVVTGVIMKNEIQNLPPAVSAVLAVSTEFRLRSRSSSGVYGIASYPDNHRMMISLPQRRKLRGVRHYRTLGTNDQLDDSVLSHEQYQEVRGGKKLPSIKTVDCVIDKTINYEKIKRLCVIRHLMNNDNINTLAQHIKKVTFTP